MKEWIRTVILVVLLVFSIGFIFWMQNGVNSNFVDQIDNDGTQPTETDTPTPQ